MQRTYQMYVIPDLIDPKKFKQATTRLDIVIDGSNEGPIEPGTRVDPQATFSETPKKYTILMVDPDEPSEELRSYKQKCHWAVCNATFDIYNNALSESSGAQELVPYVPPHPAYGSKTHRYVYIAFLQDNELTASTIEQLGARLLKSDIKEIEGIDLRKISEEFGLLPVGVSFYRSEWNESVDSVYTDILGQDSPRFGAPLVPNKFLDQYGNKLSRYENI
ncbi:39S ribosomal protein L38, mitochondrial [Zancudomyces culisetae]|uniref:39S ribosomal protein L38, mitochondrial n=1 Tax=Zancudomyces culisetae TaxID=1213189 RepID=A0A1R1PTJ2_ZANCU|nr:39S ribosomal protein L38, mitochondrial [Zancudomyces culisetae]|eukprot:OMH84271.1 39S ribosomal protein L38, mitochondrial [Zancudomyces culisetae]